ncbi:hypothetical protein KEM48_010216 [Puccinia striiformis f. sp. tritici PST-130]|nr:hypothetical protein KEM48_010216 [Puccinia striiformis f. sp. tritici PST-130]
MQVGRSRTRRDTRSQAIRWRDSDILAKQKRLLKLHGTRWSELNRLPYWNPVMNVALGVMHNWYEGVLQHHWRICWAFGPKPSKHATHDDQLDDWDDYKSDDSNTSLDFQTTPSRTFGKLYSTLLSLAVSLKFLQTWEIQSMENSKQVNGIHFPQHTYHSASSTSLSTIQRHSNHASQLFKLSETYLLYTESSNIVFDNPKIVPNHRYALHLPEQIRWWGPLSNVSEFSGERVNGMLQKMKTNSIVGQIEGTVIREFCQTQRFNSQAPTWSLETNDNEPESKHDNESESKSPRLVELHPKLYVGLLNKLQAEHSTLRNYQDYPHPDGSSVLTPYANEEDAFTSKTGIYFSKTKQNRLVAYDKNGHTRYGWITHIYSLPELNGRVLVAVNSLVDACSGDAVEFIDSFLQTLNNLQQKVVPADAGRELLDPWELIAVCGYRHLPAWTFGYHLPLIVLRQIPTILPPYCFHYPQNESLLSSPISQTR